MNFSLRFLTTMLVASCASTALSSAEDVAPPAYELALPSIDDGLPGVGPLRRYTWFQNLWIGRRTQWAREATQDHGAIVFLGDSITQGWGDQLATSFPGLKVANRGISGDTTRGVLVRLDRDVLALDPAAIVLLIGTNDIEEVARADAIASNLDLILQRIAAHNPTTPVLLNLVFPSSAKMKRGRDLITDVNTRYLAIAAHYPQVTVLDTWTLFADETGNAKPDEMPDLLHPNVLGYAKWTAVLVPALDRLGFHLTPAPAP